MKNTSPALASILTGSFTTRLVIDSFYGPTRTKEDLGEDGWELNWNSEGEIKSAGRVDIVYTDDLAQSLTPNEFADTLAPFGQELNILLEVTAGDGFTETIQQGRYLITGVPDARDEHMNVLGELLTIGSRVTLTLEDRMVRIKRAGFRSGQAPASLASCWAELQRISGMQVIRSVADKPIPVGLIYKAAEGGRLDAVQALARILDGVAYITPDGALSVLPDVWGAPVAALVLGADGTILDVGHSMESEDVFNEIVGNFQDADRNPIYAVAAVITGPLATTGPFGRYTRYVTSEQVSTQAEADAYVRAALAIATSTQVYRVPVQCVLDPRLDDGDVVTVERPTGGTLTGRIANHRIGNDGTMSLELDVQRNV